VGSTLLTILNLEKSSYLKIMALEFLLWHMARTFAEAERHLVANLSSEQAVNAHFGS